MPAGPAAAIHRPIPRTNGTAARRAFTPHGFDEALGFAVHPVIAHHPLDSHAVPGEPIWGAFEKADGGLVLARQGASSPKTCTGIPSRCRDAGAHRTAGALVIPSMQPSILRSILTNSPDAGVDTARPGLADQAR
jgi:hypothetical protein